MSQIGLFFGSFNPIHVGHLIIANHFIENTDLDEVWFVVSPHNPFKEKKTLATERNRLNMVRAAIQDNIKLHASDIEFKLAQPSYTIDTLTVLSEKYPNKNFSLIMGSDNLLSIQNWKNYKQITDFYPIYVFERPDKLIPETFNREEFKKVIVAKAPMLQISASYIRECILNKKSIRYLVPDAVIAYIESAGLYKK